jgi:hypothetical protein
VLESVDGMVGNWEFQQGEKQREQQVGTEVVDSGGEWHAAVAHPSRELRRCALLFSPSLVVQPALNTAVLLDCCIAWSDLSQAAADDDYNRILAELAELETAAGAGGRLSAGGSAKNGAEVGEAAGVQDIE